MKRLLVALAILAALWPLHVAGAPDIVGIRAVLTSRAQHYGIAPQELIDLAGCETGWTWDQRVIGKQGELGPFQLHPKGKLRHFYASGYTDPFDWFEAGDYTAWQLSLGGGRAWSCYKG